MGLEGRCLQVGVRATPSPFPTDSGRAMVWELDLVPGPPTLWDIIAKRPHLIQNAQSKFFLGDDSQQLGPKGGFAASPQSCYQAIMKANGGQNSTPTMTFINQLL